MDSVSWTSYSKLLEPCWDIVIPLIKTSVEASVDVKVKGKLAETEVENVPLFPIIPYYLPVFDSSPTTMLGYIGWLNIRTLNIKSFHLNSVYVRVSNKEIVLFCCDSLYKIEFPVLRTSSFWIPVIILIDTYKWRYIGRGWID